jgi:hypothetical protein
MSPLPVERTGAFPPFQETLGHVAVYGPDPCVSFKTNEKAVPVAGAFEKVKVAFATKV